MGGGAFVEEVLKATQTSEKPMSALKRKGWGFDKVVAHAAQAVGMEPADLLRRGRANARSRGRQLAAKWLVMDLGESQIKLAARLGIGQSSVARLVAGGVGVELDLGIGLATDHKDIKA